MSSHSTRLLKSDLMKFSSGAPLHRLTHQLPSYHAHLQFLGRPAPRLLLPLRPFLYPALLLVWDSCVCVCAGRGESWQSPRKALPRCSLQKLPTVTAFPAYTPPSLTRNMGSFLAPMSQSRFALRRKTTHPCVCNTLQCRSKCSSLSELSQDSTAASCSRYQTRPCRHTQWLPQRCLRLKHNNMCITMVRKFYLRRLLCLLTEVRQYLCTV